MLVVKCWLLMNTILGVVLWVLVVDNVLKFGASEGTCLVFRCWVLILVVDECAFEGTCLS